MSYKIWYYEVAVEAGTTKVFKGYNEDDIPKKMQKIIEKLNDIDCIKEFLKADLSKEKKKNDSI